MTTNILINKLIDEIPLDLSNLFYEVNQVGHVHDDPYDSKFEKEFDYLYSTIGQFMIHTNEGESEVVFIRDGEVYSFESTCDTICLSKIQNRQEYVTSILDNLSVKISDIDSEINLLNKRKSIITDNIAYINELKGELCKI